MGFTVDSAALELTIYISARIIHKELLRSEVISTLGGDHLPLHLNSSATTNSINKWAPP